MNIFFTVAIPSDGPNGKNFFMFQKSNRENCQSRKKWRHEYLDEAVCFPVLSSNYSASVLQRNFKSYGFLMILGGKEANLPKIT